MNEQECLNKMVAPGQVRPGKPAGGVIQILVTSSCDKSCYNCTQASNAKRPLWAMTTHQFEQAIKSLKSYWGTVGVFGGNPCLHREFPVLCEILRRYFPKDRCGLWSNNPITPDNAKAARITFSEGKSNLNVHLDSSAYDLFRVHWPESRPFGLREDSRHSPPWVAMRDVLRKECPACKGAGDYNMPAGRFAEPGSYSCVPCGGTGKVYDESRAWELISNCDINQHWSAGVGVFRGQLRGWFCEVAMAQSILHQDEPDYPDTGIWIGRDGKSLISSGSDIEECSQQWWQLPMSSFQGQVRKHCNECGVPMRGYGELAQVDDKYGKEQVSATHQGVYRPKRTSRTVEVVTDLTQLGIGKIQMATNYIGNAAK